MVDAAAREKLERLRSLAPPEQDAFAARLVEVERNVDVVLGALAVLEERPDPTLRPLLLRRYAHYNHDGARRDPAGTLRVALLRALRLLVLPEDAPLLEQAATTYEFRFGESAADLRAAGVLTLNEVDGTLAGYHAVRLLTDQHTNIMSGEPALTAARVLAAQGQTLALYAYASRSEPSIPDVVAEALRSLTNVPASLLPALVERYGGSEDEIVLLGLFDLLLGHPARPRYLEFLYEFLRTTRLHNLERYLASALVALRDESVVAELARMAASQRDRAKAELLREALALR